MKRRSTVYIALALIVLASACGARVPEEQAAAARGQTVSAGQTPGSGSTEGLAAGETPTGEQATGDPAAAGDAGQAAQGEAAPAAPEGGNGGATDVGVTDTEVLLGNVSTLSGPVPGLFQGAVYGTQAAIAYQNSKGGLFGRKFKLETRDDQLDTGQNRNHTTDLLGKVFAFVGSFSLFDDAAAAEITKSGIPDVTFSLSPGRRQVPNNFSVSPAPASGAPTGTFRYWAKKSPEAVKAVGTLYVDLQKTSHDDYKAAAQESGWTYKYERAFQATETDFTADVVRMRQEGVKTVFLVAVDDKTIGRVAKAMKQQGFAPELFIVGGSGYDADMPAIAAAEADGMIVTMPYAMFAGEDSGAIPEVKLFNEWLQKVKPGFKPDLFSAYAWASGRLFFQALEKAGPKAKRADVVNALRAVGEFSANGLMAPANPGAKTPPTCLIYVQFKGGKYSRLDSPPPGFRCNDGPYMIRKK